MSYANQPQMNITIQLQYQMLLERLGFSALSTVSCCMFIVINVTLLFTLRSKPVFCETSRYILLYNLLLADTMQLTQGQVMYLLAVFRLIVTYPVCGVLIMLANLTKNLSPLTLMLMCLERYVAVCFPLRHNTIITSRNTWVAIIVIWVFSSLNVLIQVLLMLVSSFEDNEVLQMTDFCGKGKILRDPLSSLYNKAYTYFLFISAGVVVISSYIGVVVAARSASTDKASAKKARNTLLLHLVQLGLSLSSTIHNPLLIAVSAVLDRIIFVRIQIIIYVCIIILPRCLSSLIYGLRDKTIRPVLVHNLCCQWRCSVSVSHSNKS